MCVGLSVGRSTPRIRGTVLLLLSLPLLVAGVGADHQQLAVAADQLAVLADPLHTRSNLHGAWLLRGRSGRHFGKCVYSRTAPIVQGGGAPVAGEGAAPQPPS